MVRTTSNELTTKKLNKAKLQLCKALGEFRGEDRDLFLESLLGPEEYSIIAKRLLILIFLLQGNTVSEIARALQVSKSTVSEIKKDLRIGRYKYIKKVYTNIEFGVDDIAKATETVLRLGGPLPMAGDSLHDVVQGKHLDYKQKYKESEEKRRVFRKYGNNDPKLEDFKK